MRLVYGADGEADLGVGDGGPSLACGLAHVGLAQRDEDLARATPSKQKTPRRAHETSAGDHVRLARPTPTHCAWQPWVGVAPAHPSRSLRVCCTGHATQLPCDAAVARRPRVPTHRQPHPAWHRTTGEDPRATKYVKHGPCSRERHLRASKCATHGPGSRDRPTRDQTHSPWPVQPGKNYARSKKSN